MGSASFDLRRKQRIDDAYNELRAIDGDLHRECIQSAEGIVLNSYIALASLDDVQRLKLCADIEAALVAVALRGRRG